MGTRMDQHTLEIPETKPEKVLRKIALFATSFFFIFTGMRHLIAPDFYMILMPKFFPLPLFLIYFTGVLQMVCALGLLFVRSRKWAAVGLMIFLVSALPTLVYLWVYKSPIPTSEIPSWLRLLSLPLQFSLIFWVYQFAKKPKSY